MHSISNVLSVIESRAAEPRDFDQQIVVMLRLARTYLGIRNAFLQLEIVNE